MKKIVKFFSAFVLLLCVTFLFAACGNKKIPTGTYYLEDNEESYIVLTDKTISFHNVDFSNVEQTLLDEFGETVDVAAALFGERPYDAAGYSKDNVVYIYVAISEEFSLRILYYRNEKTLMCADHKYILHEE